MSSDNVNLSTFPGSVFEALAMLYIQNQDLKGKTASEIHTMYREAHKELMEDYKNKRNSGYKFR